ncbi:MAG: sugar ABC transporter permease [Pseudolabrys sp.]|nr:sugar ABC transporter permease [Pseudolabrys sp.]MBV9954604.1 sugar ABC transporter permease [Pseudolabrys sp.]
MERRPPNRLSAWWWRHQRVLTPFVLLAPAVLMFLLFVIYPITQSVWLSLFDWRGVGAKRWVGLQNYFDLLRDEVALTALANNLIWLATFLAAPMLGLGLAVFLSQNLRGIQVVRTLFMAPFVISQVVVGMIFALFLNSNFGLLNRMLEGIGFSPVAPLESETWAIVGVIAAGLWPQLAYCLILYLAGLTALRGELTDTARIDGAHGFTLFWNVVLPQLRPVTFIAAMVCVVTSLRSFDLVMIMTAGGPYDSSNVLAFYMYEQTFHSLRYGYGATVATALFVLMGSCVGFFLWRLLRREAA